ncbi:MAG: Gfo/Idh/MocA family oxidoreductase [Caldilineaceae bacterium]
MDDWRRLFDLDIDVLVCCLPHNMHVEPTEAAAQQGVHVLMEKPIATTLEDARRIVDLCREAKVKLTTSFVHRFRDEVQTVHEWITTGRIGQPMMARETMNGQRGRHLRGGWRARNRPAAACNHVQRHPRRGQATLALGRRGRLGQRPSADWATTAKWKAASLRCSPSTTARLRP